MIKILNFDYGRTIEIWNENWCDMTHNSRWIRMISNEKDDLFHMVVDIF